MNPISQAHAKLRHALTHKLDLHSDITTEDHEISEAVGGLIYERNALRDSHSMIATALQIDSTKPSDILKTIADVKALLANAPDTTQPQLSEIRYVLHGDIQPCSVLYSDETTTLLRLDEGDVMCESDTIEWSDSVTYRCQQLLKSCGVRSLGHVAPRLAQLVRDERILLNDNGDDAGYPKTVQIKVDNFSSENLSPGSIEVVKPEDEGTHTVCTQCERVFAVTLDLCPQCHTRQGPLPLDTPTQLR